MVKKKKQFKSRSSSRKRSTHRRYPVDYKLKAVRLHLDDGVSQEIVAEQMDVSQTAVGRWVRQFTSNGAAGLEDKPRKAASGKMPKAVKDQIITFRDENILIYSN